MYGLIRAVVVAQIVGRNAVPLVGILLSGWSATNVILLYFWDTLLSFGVVFAGVAQSMSTAKDDATPGAAPSQVQTLGAAVLLCAVFAIPLGLPIGIVVASSGFSFGGALRDRSLWIGILVQCAFAGWSYSGLYRALRTHTPQELRLKQRFGLILMRWVAVLAVCFFLLQFGTGKVVLVLLVATYVVASIVAEIAPDQLLRGTPADEPEAAVRGRTRREGEGRWVRKIHQRRHSMTGRNEPTLRYQGSCDIVAMFVGAAALAVAFAATAADSSASGTVTYQAKSGAVTAAPKYAFLVKGPDAVDKSRVIRHLILSTTDLGAKIGGCKTMSCTDADLGDGMTVDLDAGPRLNYWVVFNGQKVQYSGTVQPAALKITIDAPSRLAGKLVIDDSAAGGARVDVEFDASLVKEFR